MNKLIIAIAAAAALMTSVAVTMRAQGQPSTEPSATDKVRIVGWALNMSNIATGANQTIQIDIDGWSNPSQRQHLIETFLEKKQDGLLKELEKQPERGRFNFPGYMGPDPNNTMRLGTDLRYAMNFPGEDGGRRIVIFSGGEAKGTEEVLAEIKGLADGGAFGSIMGRNAFQRPKADALKLLKAVQDIYRAAK